MQGAVILLKGWGERGIQTSEESTLSLFTLGLLSGQVQHQQTTLVSQSPMNVTEESP